MTKNLMKDCVANVLFKSIAEKKILLVVDSWSSWKDKAAFAEVYNLGKGFK
jgi:hypothetical protein